MTRPPYPPRPTAMAGWAVVVLGLCLTHTFPTPTTASSPSSSTTSAWTFNQPGVSHMTFEPSLSSSGLLRLELTFRTLQANGLLVYQEVSGSSEAEEEDEEVRRLLRSFHLFVEMRQGHLRVGHMFDHFKDIVNVGRALNDDQWHGLLLTLNQTSGQLSVNLDSSPVSLYLKAYIWGSARRVLDWARVHTSLLFGGVTGERSHDFPTFIGCLKGLRYSGGPAEVPLADVPTPMSLKGVDRGCLDRCQVEGGGGGGGEKGKGAEEGEGERCLNGGRCVNLYTDFHCDCFGTSFEGRRCEHAGPTVLTFSGYEWVTYRVYDGESNRPFSDHNTVALEFKTEEPSGILMYAVGGSPYHNHITAALRNGLLHVSLAFGQQDLDFPLGRGLNDNRWHNLTIEHQGRQVTVTLDGRKTSQSVTNSDPFISLDPLAYFGGGDKFVVTRGLPVTRNYIGCMRNIYFNGHSILYQLSNGSDTCLYHGGETPTFGCSPERDVPLSFPNAASMLRWRLGSRGGNLSTSFSLRTVREDGILFYVELVSRREGGGSDYGLMEVWIREGRPVLVFIPSLRSGVFNENITIPAIVNDQQWHTLSIHLEHSQAKLTVDGLSGSSRRFSRPLNHKGQVILGFGLRGYKKNEGYVGCLKSVVIQGQQVDPITVVESSAAIGLRLDGCFLVDHCSVNNICRHDSRCLSDWDGVQCDCLGDHYEGKACHFPHYPRTCDAYYQAGHIKSGVYLVDVDGSGPLPPSYVRCSMGSQRDGHLYGATVVDHNFDLVTPVRGPRLEDRRYDLTYREMNRAQLIALGQTSASCEQFFKYTCQHSPLLLGKKTWFKAASGQVVDYLGTAQSGHCTCSGSSCRHHTCNCDQDGGRRAADEGYSREKDQLPIMEMTFLQRHPSPGTANMTLGPFTCWGSERQRLDNLVTFTTEHSHLRLDRWTTGDLGFHFKTHHHNALLLMHTSQDMLFGNMLSIKIVSENSVEFYFRLNGTIIRERLRVPTTVNEGDWHFVLIEHDAYNMRLSLDTTRVLVSLDSTIRGVVDYDGFLYLGGLPKDVAERFGERTPGVSGCIRAFLYNHHQVELSTLVDGSTEGVSTGCMSSCWPNPCQHGGTCVEDWGHYSCVCQDPWAHQGHNCEHNLNTDAATFSGAPASYLTFDMLSLPSPLDQTIVLSFRTFQMDALLFYAHDHLSNFVQMELQQGDTVLFTYNSYETIVSGAITAPAALNDGQWHQVVAQEYYNLTKLIVGEQSHIIEYKHAKLGTHSVNPFQKSAQKETVFIARSFRPPRPFLRLYVGGIAEGGTASPFLKGCVRGMRVGSHHVSLRQGARAKGDFAEVTPACETGCKEDTCQNDGYCNEHWRYGNFTCDCSESDFSGINCEKEASVLLDGRSVLKHTFTLPVSAQRSVTEQIMLTFKTSGTKATNRRGEPLDMALIYITSSEYSDYILAKLDSDGNVLIETNQGVGIYRMKVAGDFASGEQHELVYKREGTNMYLTLDGVKKASIAYPDYDLDQIDTIIVGGVLADAENTFDHITNFTGCISNTVFIPEANLDLKIRSLKDFHLNSPDITVYGGKVDSCSVTTSSLVKATTPPQDADLISEGFEVLTMPPWEVGPARLVTLSPSLRLSTTPPPTTTTTNGSAVIVFHKAGAEPSDYIVIIVVLIIAVILLAMVILALWTCCKRRRRRDYRFKKEVDIELKQPLTYHSVAPMTATPTPAPAVPKDHLAKLDEFSMISATLGPRPAAKPDVTNHVEPASNRNSVASNRNSVASNRNSVGSMPKADTDFIFEHPIFNKRKQRPASSISEVLEELERRQNAKSNVAEQMESVTSVPEQQEAEWTPKPTRPTLSFGEMSYFEVVVQDVPLFLLDPIEDEQEPSHVSSLSERISSFSEKAEDSSPSADDSQGNPNSMLDGNGDSGYEAESRPGHHRR
ncbi:axotactin-like isoform X2 [Babylonia areolata]|uniref:axotactin-like isoform X2 n=1 Tax=Babylonia areolata TaxID=304850 RepID=UPI003FD12B8B